MQSVQGRVQIDAASLRGRALYHLMTSIITPRPIAWVGTRSPGGIDNLAPFSYFMGVSSKPPALAISVARAGRDLLKDTARNIIQTNEFTVSMVSAELADAMNTSSGRWPSDTSEFEMAALTPVRGAHVSAPYPEQAHVSMECRLVHSHDMGTTHLLVGEIVCFHIGSHLLEGDEMAPVVDTVGLDPLARLGGQQYCRLVETMTIPPPVIE